MSSFVDQESEASKEIIARVEVLAEKKRLPMATVALSYCLHQGIIPVVGLNSHQRIDESILAVSCELSESDITSLTQPYRAQPIRGFQ